MKIFIKCVLFFTILIFAQSCLFVYDPPRKGKEIWIDNQTDKSVLILDSLNAPNQLYVTSKVNGRRYILRYPYFMPEYSIYTKFISEDEVKYLKRLNKNYITFYISNVNNSLVDSNSLRSFNLNLDTFKKYDINRLFIYKDTVILEHSYDYQ